MEKIDYFTDGKNFNEEPLKFEEFIGKNGYGHTTYNNFFFNFGESLKNYEMLKNINIELAKSLSLVYRKYVLKKGKINEDLLKGHSYPKVVLEKGYEAYLLLRKHYSKDPDLLQRIETYHERTGGRGNSTDDWPAFFS